MIQFAQSQIQIKLLAGQCCEQQNDSALQTQQEFTAIKQYHAIVVVSLVFQMLVWFSPDLIPFHLLTWQLVIGCTEYQI